MIRLKNVLRFAFICISGSWLVSCGEDVDVETETSISYTLTISPDLLKFVTPQVSYVDENGVIVTITGIEELDGKVIENGVEISSGGIYASAWSQQVITGTGYKCWTLKMKFKHLNFHSYMGVKYLKNELAENTNDKIYDFHHNVNTSISTIKSTTTTKSWPFGSVDVDVKAYSDSHISISTGDYHIGDSVSDYIDNLINNPDKVGYFVDENGDVFRKDEFDL